MNKNGSVLVGQELSPERQQVEKVNMDRLLEELHEKKRWLDTVIAGLEKAVNSPDHQLIEIAYRVFTRKSVGRPRVDIGQRQQRRLASLASRVGTGRRRRARVQSSAA